MSRLRPWRRAFTGGWIYPHRRLRLTRDGWFFLAITMAIGFASLNTGHNLFYLIFAMQVSMVVVSGLLSERTLRHLQVQRRLPREVFARAATAIEFRVENAGRRRTAYAVEIRDALGEEPRRRVGFVDRLDAGGERVFHVVWSFPLRGRHRFRDLHLVTRFPFGLFEKTRIVKLDDDVVVFPAVDRTPARASAFDASRAAIRKHRLGEELIGLRRKLPEDDRRQIHWRVSARVGELMVKDPGQSLDRPLSIFFDSRGAPGSAFEAAVERAAGLVWQAANEGRRLDFYSWEYEARNVGRDSWHGVLGWLGEVRPKTETGTASFERWRNESTRSGGGLFVTSGEPPALPPGTVLRVA